MAIALGMPLLLIRAIVHTAIMYMHVFDAYPRVMQLLRIPMAYLLQDTATRGSHPGWRFRHWLIADSGLL